MDKIKEYTILIIDDDEVDRKNYQRLLKQHDLGAFNFYETDTAVGALELIDQKKPDCVLLDFMLPDMSGIQFLEKLNSFMERLPAIIMITGAGDEKIAVQALKNGIEDYLIKDSINENSLKAAILNAIEKTNLKKQLKEKQDEVIRKNEELSSLNKDLSATNESLKKFAHTIAHDIRDPLSSMIGIIELISQEEENISESNMFLLNEASLTGYRILEMLANILKYAECTQASYKFDSVDLNLLFDNLRLDLKTKIESQKAVIQQGDFPVIWGNYTMLYQVFLNLMSNSLKFARENIELNIQIHSKIVNDSNKEYCQIIFEDNGIGIASNKQDVIFEEFKRLSGAYDGCGIGLSIVKKVVEKHLGRITVESSLGKYTRFNIMLPLNKDDVSQISSGERSL